jgi:malate permease and related proteins
MNEAILKTLVLVLLIGLGLALKAKFKLKEQTNGIKEIVLSVALPSTIFIALMKIHLEISMLIVPLITLAFGFFMYWISPFAVAAFGVNKNSPAGRTMALLLPSLAPGLSSFPFILEFLGDESLALAAMADIGNKFFVLIFLYVIAMNMFLKNTNAVKTNAKDKIKSLLISLIKEPINIILFVAIGLLCFGWNYETLPALVTGVFDKTSALMTPLVLIFIGLAVKLKQKNKGVVFSILLFRAGISLIFSALLISIMGIADSNLILLATAIPLSSVSFWPFAHISLFNSKEEEMDMPKDRKTFDVELAVMVLAISLPLSTILILGILSAGTYFAEAWKILLLGVGSMALGVIPYAISKLGVFSSVIARNRA